MNKKSTIFLIVILLIGALLGFGVYYGLSVGTEQVVVPSVEVKAGDMFTSENLKVISIPKAITLDSVMYKTPDEIVGKYALSSLVPNEPITVSKLSDRKSDGYVGYMEDAEHNYTLLVPVQSDQPIRNISPGDRVSLFSSITLSQEERVTGKLGDSYNIVGVEMDKEENVSGVTIEVEPNQMANISHMIINADYILSFVSVDQIETNIDGITSEQFIETLLSGNVLEVEETPVMEDVINEEDVEQP